MGGQAFGSLGNIGTMEFLAATVGCVVLYLAHAVNFPNIVVALIAANAVTALWMMPTRALGLIRRGALAGSATKIFIGSENELFSLSGSSLVVSSYMNADRKIVGAVGVIGPTRLNYGRIVPIVDYTAQLVGRVLSDRKG